MPQDFLLNLRALLKWAREATARRDKTPADKAMIPVLQRLHVEVASHVEGVAGDGI